jgi:hypothetical protein
MVMIFIRDVLTLSSSLLPITWLLGVASSRAAESKKKHRDSGVAYPVIDRSPLLPFCAWLFRIRFVQPAASNGLVLSSLAETDPRPATRLGWASRAFRMFATYTRAPQHRPCVGANRRVANHNP